MNTMLKCRYIGVFCLCVFVCSSLYCVADETSQHPKVLLAPPERMSYDADLNLLFFYKLKMLYAYELGTNKCRWSLPLLQDGLRWKVTFGGRYLIAYSENEVVVLGKNDGKPIKHIRNRRMGTVEYAGIADDDQWIGINYNNGYILYSLTEDKNYKMPKEENIRGSGSLPDGRGWYKIWKSPEQHYEVYFSPSIDSTENTKQYDIHAAGELYNRVITPKGEIPCIEFSSEEGWHLRIYDVFTGNLLRDLPYTKAEHGYLNLVNNNIDQAVFIQKDDWGWIRSLDTRTGEILVTIQGDGHRFFSYCYTDDSERMWYLSKDEHQNIWVWPFEENAQPRKIFDGAGFLSGEVQALRPPYYLVNDNYYYNFLRVINLDTGERVAEYKGIGYIGYLAPNYFSADMRRMIHVDDDIGRRTFVYQADQKQPLLSTPESGHALSPDGRYLLCKSRNGITLIDVDSSEIRFQLPNAASTHAFSPGSQYVAVFNKPTLTLLDTDSGEIKAKRISGDVLLNLCFSPDGTLLLAEGNGKTILYDAHNLHIVHEMKETKKFQASHRSSEGFMDDIASSVMDYAGIFTDRFKGVPRLQCSFFEDGEKVITIAEGQIIRVWNTATGKLERTIDPKLPEVRDTAGMIRNNIRLSSNGAYAIAYNGNGFGEASLWDIKTGRRLNRYHFKDEWRIEATVSDDGKSVYALLSGDLHFLVGNGN
jgi:WD40 repeat protein